MLQKWLEKLWYDDWKRAWYFGVTVLTILLFYAGYKVITYRNIQTMTLRSMAWENKIDVQTFSLVYESGWSLPVDARLSSTAREYYGTERYISGYRSVEVRSSYNCGSAKNPKTCPIRTTRQEAIYSTRPVYRTKFYYTIDRWITTRQLVARGNDDKPYWPNTSDLHIFETIQYGSERTGTTYAHYAVVFIDSKQKQHFADVTLSAYTEYIIGGQYKVTLNIFNVIMKIEDSW